LPPNKSKSDYPIVVPTKTRSRRPEPRVGIYFRAPYSLVIWLEDHSAETGLFKNDHLVRALIEYRARIEDEKKKNGGK